jgi:hypothetical protein
MPSQPTSKLCLSLLYLLLLLPLRLGIEEPTWDDFYGPATVEEAKPFDEFFSHTTDMEMDMLQVSSGDR